MTPIAHPELISQLSDPDMQAAPAALLRAAIRARELAARTGTPLIVSENGQVVERAVNAEDLAAGDEGDPESGATSIES